MSDGSWGQVLTAIAAIAERIGRIEDRLDRIEDRLDRIENRLDRVEDRLDRMENRLDRVEASQVQLRADLLARIDRLQDAMTAQKEAEAVNWGAAERAERMARTALDDSRITAEQIGAMRRQILRLQTDVSQLQDRLDPPLSPN